MKRNITSLALIAAGCLAASAAHPMFPNPTLKIERDETPADVTAYIVSEDGSNAMTRRQYGFDSSADAVDATVTLNPSTQYQEIDGFGFAITGSAAYNLLKMTPDDRHAFLTATFSPEHGYGSSYVRVPIGCSDFSLSEYTCCDTPGIENFALTAEETDYIIPVMKEILAINPAIKVITAPWTAPRWMKTDYSWTGGHLKPEYYQDYATYFVKWIKAFQNEGIDITAMTPQNEPQNPGNSASMLMDWDEERDFIKTALGPAFQREGITTRIFVFDHNYNYDNKLGGLQYPVEIYKDAEAKKYITGAAYHNYGGNASEMTSVHNQYPDMQLLFTEWTAGTWSHGVDISETTSDVKALVFDVTRNWGRGAMVWNLMLDSDRGPNRPGGCVTGNGAVDIQKPDYKKITYNSFYYAMSLASAAVTPGARRIDATGTTTGIDYVTFRNPEGYGMVVTNKNSGSKRLRIDDGNNRFVVEIPANSAMSLRW